MLAYDTRLNDAGKIGSAIDALLRRFADRGSATSAGDRTVPASERALAAAIELIFGLFLLSGMGFVYRGQRLVGWTLLLPRVFATYVTALAVGSVSSMLGLLAGLVVWALLPVGLALIVANVEQRPRPMSEHGGLAVVSLEGLGVLGLSGVGWISAGRPGMGVPILVIRFLTLGAGTFFLPLLFLATADSCVSSLASCGALELGLSLWVIFLLALWLVFPVASAALLRRAQRLATHLEEGDMA